MLYQKERTIDGKVFTISGDSEDQSVFNNILNNSDYENHMIDFYKELLNEDSVCIDAGANIGILSMYMSLFTKATIYAFEPIPETYSALVTNIERNNLNIKSFCLALGDKSGKSIALFDRKSNGGASFEYNSQKPDEIKIDIEVITLDDFVKKENIDRLDLLKMDVEGFEELVIRGGKETMERLKPDVVTEFCPTIIREKGLSSEGYFDTLRSYYKYIYFIDRPNMKLVTMKDHNHLEQYMLNGYHGIGDVFATNKEL